MYWNRKSQSTWKWSALLLASQQPTDIIKLSRSSLVTLFLACTKPPSTRCLFFFLSRQYPYQEVKCCSAGLSAAYWLGLSLDGVLRCVGGAFWWNPPSLIRRVVQYISKPDVFGDCCFHWLIYIQCLVVCIPLKWICIFFFHPESSIKIDTSASEVQNGWSRIHDNKALYWKDKYTSKQNKQKTYFIFLSNTDCFQTFSQSCVLYSRCRMTSLALHTSCNYHPASSPRGISGVIKCWDGNIGDAPAQCPEGQDAIKEKSGDGWRKAGNANGFLLWSAVLTLA